MECMQLYMLHPMQLVGMPWLSVIPGAGELSAILRTSVHKLEYFIPKQLVTPHPEVLGSGHVHWHAMLMDPFRVILLRCQLGRPLLSQVSLSDVYYFEQSWHCMQVGTLKG